MWYPEFTIIYILLFVATAVAIASLVLVIIVLKKLSDVEITLSTMKKYRDFSPAAPGAQGEIPQPQNRNVIFCKNPRCITSTEQEIVHSFKLADAEKRIYRCVYCDAEHK